LEVFPQKEKKTKTKTKKNTPKTHETHGLVEVAGL
jgi:hypothetical protein